MGENEWYELVEDNPEGSPYSYFYGDIPKGRYRLQVKDDSGGAPSFTTIGHKENVHHSSQDMENHITDDDPDMRHETTSIAVPESDTARLGSTLDELIDNIAGSEWDQATDNSLKTHLDDSISAHDATAITCSIGVFTDVDSVLDDHETRISDLETGSAVTPTGIEDFHGDMGIDIAWQPQDIPGIEYAFRYIWKHRGETVPDDETDLGHQRRELAPETTVFYRSRRYDLSSNVNRDLVLYYAVGAKGRADSDFIWSAVEAIDVTLPEYNQEFTGVLNGLQLCSGGGSASVYALDSIEIGSDENWPEAVLTDGIPTDGYLRIPFQVHSVTVTAIEIFSQTEMSGDATISLRSTTTGTGGELPVASATSMGKQSGLSLPVNAGNEIQLWTENPQGMSHFRVKVWFTRS